MFVIIFRITIKLKLKYLHNLYGRYISIFTYCTKCYNIPIWFVHAINIYLLSTLPYTYIWIEHISGFNVLALLFFFVKAYILALCIIIIIIVQQTINLIANKSVKMILFPFSHIIRFMYLYTLKYTYKQEKKISTKLFFLCDISIHVHYNLWRCDQYLLSAFFSTCMHF